MRWITASVLAILVTVVGVFFPIFASATLILQGHYFLAKIFELIPLVTITILMMFGIVILALQYKRFKEGVDVYE